MLKAIIENPYRILGVYSNAKDNEIMAAADKLLSSPDAKCDTDFSIPGLLKPRRDYAAITAAKQKALDLGESACYKMFWFMKSPDNAGYKELLNGDVCDASNAWFYSSTDESKHNILVGYLVENNFEQIAYEAYDLLFKQDYRQNLLGTRAPYIDLMSKFKAHLFDDSNAASVPIGVGLSWKKYVQDKVLTGFSNTLYTSYLKRAKSQIDPEIPSSYLSALSTMMTAWTHLRALREFADITDKRYSILTQELVDNVQYWIEEYLPKSQDLFKHRTVQTYATAFSIYAPKRIQAAYLSLLGWNLQKAGELRITPDICDLADDTARRIYNFYQSGNVSSASFRSLIEQIAPSFIRLRESTTVEDACYQRLANFMAEVGLKIIDTESTQELTEQIIADGGSVICYIDNVIDSKLLNDNNRAERNRCMNRLWDLGLGPVKDPRFPNARRKMRWDSALFKDEDATFKTCSYSLQACQNYLRRFPKGKYVAEVQALIAKNDFKYPSKSAGSSQSQTKTSSQHGAYQTYTNSAKPGTSAQRSASSSVPPGKTYVSTPGGKTISVKTLVEQDRVFKFVLIALILELVIGVLIGVKAMLISGLILAMGYWLYIPMSDKSFDRSARKVMYPYLLGQLALSIVGLFLIH